MLATSAAVQNYAAEVFKMEMFKMTVAFMLAAAAHRKWVKKDMGEHFGTVTVAMNHIGDKLGDAVAALDRRMIRLEQNDLLRDREHSKLVARIEKLEVTNQLPGGNYVGDRESEESSGAGS